MPRVGAAMTVLVSRWSTGGRLVRTKSDKKGNYGTAPGHRLLTRGQGDVDRGAPTLRTSVKNALCWVSSHLGLQLVQSRRTAIHRDCPKRRFVTNATNVRHLTRSGDSYIQTRAARRQSSAAWAAVTRRTNKRRPTAYTPWMARMVDSDLLSAALAGYEEQRKQIEARIAELRKRLSGPMPLSSKAAARPARKHRISAEGRARIAAAQRKRWAATKRAGAAAS